MLSRALALRHGARGHLLIHGYRQHRHLLSLSSSSSSLPLFSAPSFSSSSSSHLTIEDTSSLPDPTAKLKQTPKKRGKQPTTAKPQQTQSQEPKPTKTKQQPQEAGASLKQQSRSNTQQQQKQTKGQQASIPPPNTPPTKKQANKEDQPPLKQQQSPKQTKQAAPSPLSTKSTPSVTTPKKQQSQSTINTPKTPKAQPQTTSQDELPTAKRKKRKKPQEVVEEAEKPVIPLIPVQVKAPKKKKAAKESDVNNVNNVKDQKSDPATADVKKATEQVVTTEAPPKKKWTTREWVIYIGKKREEWKAQQRASRAAATRKTNDAKLKEEPKEEVKVKPAGPILPFDLDAMHLTPSEDDDLWAKNMHSFVSSVSWTQFRNFLVQFSKSNWQDGVLENGNRLRNFAWRCCKIFEDDAQSLIQSIAPHLHRMTPEILYEARKNSIEGIPLLGQTPYLAAFVNQPVSCPCVRIAVSGEPRSENSVAPTPGTSAPLTAGCACYQMPNIEIFDSSPETRTDVQKRVSILTKKSFKVFVENLHPEIGVKELMRMFCKIGQVEAVEIFRERLTGEGAEPLASIIEPEEEVKRNKKKRPPLQRQVTGQSPVYAWVYFTEKRGEQRALHPVIRLLGVNFLKHEARTHPATDKRTLYLGNLPLIPIGGLETYVASLLTNGQYQANSNLVQLLSPPPQYEYKKDLVVKETARQGFCLAEFADHHSALLAYHKLSGLSLPQEGGAVGSSKPNRTLRVGWHTTDPSMRHEAAKIESTQILRARAQTELFFPVQRGDPFAAVSDDESRVNGRHSAANGYRENGFSH